MSTLHRFLALLFKRRMTNQEIDAFMEDNSDLMDDLSK